MSELKLIAPLLTNMEQIAEVSDSGGVTKFLLKAVGKKSRYLLTRISIPESETQVDALIYSGAVQDASEAQGYFERVVADLCRELDLMASLSDQPNLSACRAYQVERKESGTGFQLYMLAPERQSLAEFLSEHAMTHARAVNLALDLCHGLCSLREAGYLHSAVTPEHVLMNKQGHFAISGLGLLPIDQLKYASVPESRLGPYSAPELFDLMSAVTETIDVYAVGQILYRIYNGNQRPFEDESTSALEAERIRTMGKPLPVPLYADYELAEILAKACAPHPADRYSSPFDLMEALIAYRKRNPLDDTLIVPPIIRDETSVLSEEALSEEVEPVQFTDTTQLGEDFVAHFSPDLKELNEIIESAHEELKEEVPPAEEPAPDTPSLDGSTPDAQGEQSALTSPPRKKRIWIPIAAGTLLLATVLAGLLYYFFSLRTLRVEALELSNATTDSITLDITTNAEIGRLIITCSDTYGNTVSDAVNGKNVTFSGLIPGTQYKIDLSAADGSLLGGTTSGRFSTLPAAEVISFTAIPISETQVELNFVVTGTEPEEWTVSYGAPERETMTATSDGHSVTVSNLEPGLTYTFTLESTDTVGVIGETSLSYRNIATIQISELAAVPEAGKITVRWNFTGDAPASWSVVCTDPAGERLTQIVNTPETVFTGLVEDEVYAFQVSAVGLLTPGSVRAKASPIVLTALSAAALDGGSIRVSMTPEDDADFGCMVAYTIAGTDVTGTAFAEGREVVLSPLVPNTEYQIAILNADSSPVGGQNAVTVRTADATKFKSFGLDGVYMGMFERPQKKEWTYRDLVTSRTSFAKTETVAFAVQALDGVTSSDEPVEILIAVSDKDGKIVSVQRDKQVWNDMWQNNLFVGELSVTPQSEGSYRASVYLNHQPTTSQSFSITG